MPHRRRTGHSVQHLLWVLSVTCNGQKGEGGNTGAVRSHGSPQLKQDAGDTTPASPTTGSPAQWPSHVLDQTHQRHDSSPK